MSGRRAVSVLSVADAPTWEELAAAHPALGGWLGEPLDALRRVVVDERALLDALGARVLVRWARRGADEAAAAREDLAHRVEALPVAARRALHAAQRHAVGEVVVGRQAWDPEMDAGSVRALHGAALIALEPGEAAFEGRYRLDPDLPPPPEIPWDLGEAVMEETEDLSAARPGPVSLLHDLAALAAAVEVEAPRLTLAGAVAKADAKRLGRRLAAADLAAGGDLDGDPRWGRAWRGLRALRAVEADPFARVAHLDLGLEPVLAGDDADACDRLVHRLVEPDLHVILPAIRAALRQAGDGAVDELVFQDLVREQHRELIFPAWRRGAARVYPIVGDETPRPMDDAGWERVEARMIGACLARCERLGLVRRAPGVFAGTADGRRWARALDLPRPPVWLTGDAELVVAPDAVTPWERFQLERLGRCLQRDVVDRYRLDRDGLRAWLATHDVEEALDLLRRRCPGVPAAVVDTLRAWARSAERIVLTRGVLVGP